MNNPDSTLSQWLKKIETSHSCSIELGLERVLEVGKKADLFHFDCKVVMIAGTNGKGSTQAALAKLLDAAGKRYATYSSPHLLYFNERVRLNGKAVTNEQLCDAFAYIESIAGDIPLTYFEFTTLAAFYIFKQTPLDVLLLEIGLGGRLDAVNAVSPDIAVITSIGYDHEAYLGHTLEDIAREKAGILRPSIPVVISEEACQSTVLLAVKANQSAVYIENRDFGLIENSQDWRFLESVIKLPNNFLPPNSVSLAMATYTILGEECIALPPLSQCIPAIKGAGMVGRFHELMLGNTTCIFDVAHNGAGAAWLAKRLAARKGIKKRHGVWSSLADKSLQSIVMPMLSHIDEWYVAGLEGVMRSSSPLDLKQILEAQGCTAVNAFQTVNEAFLAAKAKASEMDEIVVWGSFFTVAKGYLAAGMQNITQDDNGLFYR